MGPSLSGLSFKQIGEETTTRLEAIYIEEEVFALVSNLNGDKAPSSDGFCHTPSFWFVCAMPRNSLGQPSQCPTPHKSQDLRGSPQLVSDQLFKI